MSSLLGGIGLQLAGYCQNNYLKILKRSMALAWSNMRSTWASRSKLTHQVNRLESLGFVNRETCKIDARGQFAVLTKKGAAKVTKAAPDHVESVRAHLVDQLGTRFVGFGNLNATIVKHLTKIAPDDSCGTKS